MASTSAILKLGAPSSEPGPKRWPGTTSSWLVPMAAIWSETDRVAPLPRVTKVTTAAIPMTMPSMVRNERIRLRRMARRASSSGVPQHLGFLPVAAVTIHAPVDEADDAFRIRRDVGLVGDHQHGDALVGLNRVSRSMISLAGSGIEIAGWLVGQQHLGPGDDGAGDGDALLLAAGQLGRGVVLPVAQAHLVERGTAAARRLAALRGDRSAAARRSRAPSCAPAG